MLQDNHGRQSTYLRLAVTDRCNLRCRYCMPAEGIDFAPRSELLTFEEITKLCEVLAELGVNKVRLTGGEPLSRRGLPDLVDKLAGIFPTLAITTNGVLLPQHFDRLHAAGLHRYNLSLDTLRPDRFFAITRRDDFSGTWRALELLEAASLPVKINVVVMRGVNDDELLDFVALTEARRIDVRFIEAMPFNDDDGNHDVYLSATQILTIIQNAYPSATRDDDAFGSSAVGYQIPGHQGRFSIIPAYSRSLCGSCNRLRLTPKGTMLNCLYSTKGLELRPLLRSGASRQDLADLITAFVRGKHATGHVTQALEQTGSTFASMTSIGG